MLGREEKDLEGLPKENGNTYSPEPLLVEFPTGKEAVQLGCGKLCAY